jgi:hypothetical protein
MTDRTERQVAAADHGMAGAGRRGTTGEAQ